MAGRKVWVWVCAECGKRCRIPITHTNAVCYGNIHNENQHEGKAEIVLERV